jgi:hypothetical protein
MFGVLHLDGTGDSNPPIDSLYDLYDELLTADPEHGDVAVINDDTGWCISAHRDGRVIFENLAVPGTKRHMTDVTKELALSLWRRLINGEIDGLLEEPWKGSYM